MAERAAGSSTAATRGLRQLIGEAAPRISRAMAGEARFSANRCPGLDPGLRGKQKGCAGADQGADQEPGAEKADVLPVYGPPIRRSAGALDGRPVVFVRR